MSKIINNKIYRGYTINAGEGNKSPCNRRTMDQGIDRLEYMIQRHSKVLCCRLDIRQPKGGNLNLRSKMTRILEKTRRKLESDFRNKPNKIDMHYVWRAERNKSENEHVHCFIMLNGNAIHNAWRVQHVASEVVKTQLGTHSDGLVHFSKSNGKYGTLIDRNSADFRQQVDSAVYAASYLAKTRYDCNRPKGGRISSASRLPG